MNHNLEARLLRETTDPSPSKRFQAIRALGEATSERVTTALLGILAESDSNLERGAAIEALARIGDRRAIPLFVKALDDPYAPTRFHAAEAWQHGSP